MPRSVRITRLWAWCGTRPDENQFLLCEPVQVGGRSRSIPLVATSRTGIEALRANAAELQRVAADSGIQFEIGIRSYQGVMGGESENGQTGKPHDPE